MEEEEPYIAKMVHDSKADMLFVGFSSPMKEKFLNRWMPMMQVPFCMGVGGGFDIIAGRTKRAPAWMQKSGLEWCYRIYQEPRRMWKRYAKTDPVFVIRRLRRLHGLDNSYRFPLKAIFGKFSLYRYRSKREVDSQALSYGLHVLVSDIPATKEVGLPGERYFRCGDVSDLKKKMEVLLEKELSEEERKEIQNLIEEKYNWDRIAEQTIEVYRKARRA